MQLRTVEAWLADIAEKMSGVVDAGFRAQLTGEYLGLLQAWHRTPQGRRALLAPGFAERVRLLDEKTTQGMLQYKLTPGLGDLHDDLKIALEQAYMTMERLTAIVEKQTDLAVRRRWEDRLAGLTERLQRVDNDLAFAPHTTAHYSKLSALANQVNNLVAVELMPLEIEWSRALRLNVPQYETSSAARSGSINIQVNPDVWRQGLGDAAGVLEAYNAAVTEAWAEGSAGIQKQAEVPWNRFNATVQALAGLKGRMERQRQVMRELSARQPDKAAGRQANFDERAWQFNSLITEARGLADSMKKVSYDRWDEPEQVTRKLLGADAPSRDRAAVALLFSPQIESLAAGTIQAVKAADAFDADTGRNTARG